MSKTRVLIWGSCVSRDTFEHFEPEEFELIQYVARQSALSAYSRPVELIEPPTFDSPFQQRQISGDFDSNLRTLLSAAADDVDLLLVDLADERLGVYLLPDGSVVTRSVELIQSGWEHKLPEGTHFLPFGSQMHLEHWSTAITSVSNLIRQIMPRAAIALLDIAWAEHSESGQRSPDSFGIGAHEANAAFRQYVDVARAALGAHVVTLGVSDVTSDETHPWGAAPFHYAEHVYLTVVERLTGAPGRAVWAGTSTLSTLHATPARQELAPEQITGAFWRLTRADGTVAAPHLRLKPDGAIWGGSRKEYSHWSLDDGSVVFRKARDGEEYARFDTAGLADKEPRLTGRLSADGSLVDLAAVELDWERRVRPSSETKRELAAEIKRFKWKIGDHTYGKPKVLGAGRASLEIGKFCWIDSTAELVLTRRRLDATSLYSFHTTRAFWPSGDEHRPETTAAPIQIGNDVRIERGAVVLPGVTIGDGAYIGQNTVVSDDVPPYAVVEGHPGRVLGWRFHVEQVAELLQISWWNWPDADIDAALPLMSKGIEEFLEFARRGPERSSMPLLIR